MYMNAVMTHMLGVVSMPAPTSARHKHICIDQSKLDKAKKVLAATTQTEAFARALSLVVSEADIDTVLRRAGAKGKLKKLYPDTRRVVIDTNTLSGGSKGPARLPTASC